MKIKIVLRDYDKDDVEHFSISEKKQLVADAISELLYMYGITKEREEVLSSGYFNVTRLGKLLGDDFYKHISVMPDNASFLKTLDNYIDESNDSEERSNIREEIIKSIDANDYFIGYEQKII